MTNVTQRFLAAAGRPALALVLAGAGLVLPPSLHAGEPAAPEPPAAPKQLYRAGYSHTSGSYLGVGVREIDTGRARELNLAEEYGVEVTIMVPDAPAARAGLRKGDVVLSFNGQRVEGADQFVRLVQETPPGRKVRLRVNRQGSEQTIELTTGSRPRSMRTMVLPGIGLPNLQLPDMPRALMSWKNSFLGIEAEPVDSQLARFFGVKEGVLVRSVGKGTPAEKAGLLAGDVIVKLATTLVSTPREITLAIRELSSRRSFPVYVYRERKEITLTVHLEDDPAPSGPGGGAALDRYVVDVSAGDGIDGF